MKSFRQEVNVVKKGFQQYISIKRAIQVLVVLTCLGLILMGCVMPNQPAPELPPPAKDLVGTAIASTLQAIGHVPNEKARIYIPLVGSLNSEALAETPTPDFTPTPTGPTPTPTETATSTPEPPTATPVSPTPLPCLFAKFIQDINVPPGTVFAGGTKFTKIWRVQNVGSCTWNRNYTLIWVSGDTLGAKDQVALPGSVQPGQMVDLQIELVAPKEDGRYKGAWLINDNAGHIFGVGDNATDYLWVQIKVKNTGTSVAKTATPTKKPASTNTSVPTNTSAPAATVTPTATPTASWTPSPTATTPITTTLGSSVWWNP
jgi:hypothetical protein